MPVIESIPHPFRQATALIFGVAPFFSAFFFPYPFTLALAFAAGLVFPPLAFAAGALLDLLYAPAGWPLYTIAGLALALAAHFVRRFVETRIM